MPDVVQHHPVHVDLRARAHQPLALARRARVEGREHRVAYLVDRRERFRPSRVGRGPMDELGMGKHLTSAVQDERDRGGGEVSHQMFRKVRDGDYLAEHAEEAVALADGGIVQYRGRLQGLDPERVLPGGGPGPHAGAQPLAEPLVGRSVLVLRGPRSPVPHPPDAVGPEVADPRYLRGGREGAEHERVEPGFVLEIELAGGDEGGDPVRLLLNRLQAGLEPTFQGVEYRVGAFLDEASGALERAPEPEPEDHSDRERDEGAEPEHGDRGDRHAPAPAGVRESGLAHRSGSPRSCSHRLDSAPSGPVRFGPASPDSIRSGPARPMSARRPARPSRPMSARRPARPSRPMSARRPARPSRPGPARPPPSARPASSFLRFGGGEISP